MFKTLVFSLVVASVSLSFAQTPPRRGPDPDNTRLPAAYTLTLLHNNDGESKLTGVSTGSGANLQRWGGMSRFKTILDRERNAVPARRDRGVVFISSGDNTLAGAEWQAGVDSGQFFDAIGMKLMNYDAITLGNHEFDFGTEVLANFLNAFAGSTTWISANLNFAGDPFLAPLAANGRIAPSRVVTKNGERIGVIGATTDSIVFISSPGGVTVNSNYAAVIQAEVDRMTRDGVGIIIVSSHLQTIAEERALARQLRDVDAIIAGGGSEVLANPGTPLVPGDVAVLPYPVMEPDLDGWMVPIVTTNGSYRYLGKLDLRFDSKRRVIGTSGGPIRVAFDNDPGPGVSPADAVIPDAEIEAQVITPVNAFLAGYAANIIGNSAVVLDGRRGVGNNNPALVQPGVRTVETNLGNLMADSLKWAGNRAALPLGQPLANIGIQNGGGIRNEGVVAAGNLSELFTFQTAPFANFVTIVPNVSPARLKELMENAVSLVQNANGRFAQVSGFSIVYDRALTAQVTVGNTVTVPGQRVRTITLDDGTPIVVNGAIAFGAPNVNLATINFLSIQNGDQYLLSDLPQQVYPITYQNALRDYIQAPVLNGGLGGSVTAAQYPAGGTGRITRLN